MSCARPESALAPGIPDRFGQLTSQEFQIVGLVSDGSSNRSVAEQLFLSPRTVEYHLSKVYAKLGISSRSALASLDLEAAGTVQGS